MIKNIIVRSKIYIKVKLYECKIEKFFCPNTFKSANLQTYLKLELFLRNEFKLLMKFFSSVKNTDGTE